MIQGTRKLLLELKIVYGKLGLLTPCETHLWEHIYLKPWKYQNPVPHSSEIFPTLKSRQHFSYEFLNLGCSNFKSLCRLAALPLLYVVNISPSCEIQEQISLCILQSLKTIDFNCCPMETQV